MTSVQSPSLTEVSSAIRVAIVCEPEATVLADSLEALLEQARGFTSSRFEYRAESDLKPRPIGIANPDVVVATLDSFQATKVQPLKSAQAKEFVRQSPELKEAFSSATTAAKTLAKEQAQAFSAEESALGKIKSQLTAFRVK